LAFFDECIKQAFGMHGPDAVYIPRINSGASHNCLLV
jgi:hypothetical protein